MVVCLDEIPRHTEGRTEQMNLTSGASWKFCDYAETPQCENSCQSELRNHRPDLDSVVTQPFERTQRDHRYKPDRNPADAKPWSVEYYECSNIRYDTEELNADEKGTGGSSAFDLPPRRNEDGNIAEKVWM